MGRAGRLLDWVRPQSGSFHSATVASSMQKGVSRQSGTHGHQHITPQKSPAGRELDLAYAELLALAQETFQSTAAGKTLDLVSVHDLVASRI